MCGGLLANPWTILGVRKSCDAGQLWGGYAAALRQSSDERKRRRARDAYEAISLGLWGRFADSAEPVPVEADGSVQAWSYDGPMRDQLGDIDRLLSSSGPVDEIEL